MKNKQSFARFAMYRNTLCLINAKKTAYIKKILHKMQDRSQNTKRKILPRASFKLFHSTVAKLNRNKQRNYLFYAITEPLNYAIL